MNILGQSHASGHRHRYRGAVWPARIHASINCSNGPDQTVGILVTTGTMIRGVLPKHAIRDLVQPRQMHRAPACLWNSIAESKVHRTRTKSGWNLVWMLAHLHAKNSFVAVKQCGWRTHQSVHGGKVGRTLPLSNTHVPAVCATGDGRHGMTRGGWQISSIRYSARCTAATGSAMRCTPSALQVST